MKICVYRLAALLSLITLAMLTACGGGGSTNSGGGTTTKSTPTINWSTPAAITYGAALSATQLNATATVGGAAVAGTFTYSPASGAVLSAGTQTLSVSFTPTDTTTYNSATGTVSLTVNKVTPTVVWDTPAPQGYGSWLSSAGLSAIAVNGGATVAGAFTYTPAAGTYLSAQGSVALKSTFTPTDSTNYNSATGSQTLTVVKGTPSITWAEPAPVLQGTALSATQLNATANYGVAGSFSYSPALGAVMNTPGTHMLTATFTPSDTTNYSTVSTTTNLTVTSAVGAALVDFGSGSQTVQGFGASEAWSGPYDSSRISAIYGTGAGQLGLSIMRLRIAPAAWNASSQTADTTQWTAELANGKAAQDLGATVFASPWTPPVSMKDNNDSRSNKLWSGKLATASYADYAAYLKAYITYAASKGVNLYAISMQNEPDFDPTNYESCLWTADQMATWAANNGAAAISGSSVKLMMPESFSFAPGMSDVALSNATAAANIGVIGGHLYGATIAYPTAAKNANKDVWETEHYLDSTAKSNTATSWKTTIADALAAAKEVHQAMTLGQYNAYNWWWMVNSNDSQPTGLVDSSNAPTYFGLALAHYSRFVRPGYVRYAATAQPVSGVYVSAYAGSGNYVIVVINTTANAVNLPITINNAGVASLTPYQTTSTTSLAQQSAISVSSGSVMVSLPAQSITTYVR